MNGEFYGNSIFWVDVNKVRPNPYQPRKEFDESKLSDLAESIRQYGVLQPLVVTRHEKEFEDGSMSTEYELIAGERRLRASKIAGLAQIPVIIRTPQEEDRMKLELAIIENLQREDLNPLDRAKAFKRLVDEFEFTHTQIAKKIGKSREYVSNTVRLLALNDEVQQALLERKITEGHTRPLLMLADRPDEQSVLFKEIMLKGLTVRDAESMARRIAKDKVRKHSRIHDPEMMELEKKLSDSFGTRVQIVEQRGKEGERGGRLMIDFFSDEDLQSILAALRFEGVAPRVEEQISEELAERERTDDGEAAPDQDTAPEETSAPVESPSPATTEEEPAAEEKKESAESPDDLYSVRNFTI